MNTTLFYSGPIPISFIAESIQKHENNLEIGGHSIFLGQIRADSHTGKKVKGIEYTAYESMAMEQIRILRENLFNQYPLICLHIYHSLGKIRAGEICFFVFASAKHRHAALKACEDAVEKVKTNLPIWGKEIFEDDTYLWKKNS